MKRTISAMVEKGSLNHNSREFYASNVDPSRSYLNIEFCREDIRDVYHELFDDAQERFNAKQTRNDRRIENYYGKICSSKQEKPFHEIVLQIGNKDDTGIHTELAETAKQCLTEYAKGFQARNPTSYRAASITARDALSRSRTGCSTVAVRWITASA